MSVPNNPSPPAHPGPGPVHPKGNTHDGPGARDADAPVLSDAAAAWGRGPVVEPARDERHRGAQNTPLGAPTAVQWRPVLIFLAVSFVLAWLVAIPLWLDGPFVLGDSAVMVKVQITGAIMMFTPLIATAVVTFVTKTPPPGHRQAALGLGVPRRWGAMIGWIVCSIYGPLVIVGLIVAQSNLFGVAEYDYSVLREPYSEQIPTTHGTLLLVQLLTFPLPILLNAVFAFGEEIGWRGWLLDAMRPLGVWPALVATGAAWGLWHTPLILLGYNYNRHDWVGPVLMTAACVAWGVLFGWLRLRTGSVFPAVFAHAALNGAAGLTLLGLVDGPGTWSMALVGPLSLMAVLVCCEVIAVGWVWGRWRRSRAMRSRAMHE